MSHKNELFEKLFQLQKLIDKLTENGILKEKVSLPNICVIGDIKSGKTSVLESILNLNILPTEGLKRSTRCPFEINLNHIDSDKSFAIFNNTTYEDFSKLKEEIEEKLFYLEESDRIEKAPIILNIYSQQYPNLKLIDLPGFTHIPQGDAPKYMARLPIFIAKNYINNPMNIILCTIHANYANCNDYYALSGLRIAKEMNSCSEYPNDLRRICVLTKIDIMDKGTDVKNFLLNKEIPHELGYIGVINRSRKDLMNKLSTEEIFKKEKDFFNTDKIYKDLSKDLVGNEALMKKITKIYFKLIKDNLPNNLKNEEKIKDLLDLLNEYSLKEDEIFNINVVSNENKKSEESSSKSKKKYGNLFG